VFGLRCFFQQWANLRFSHSNTPDAAEAEFQSSVDDGKLYEEYGEEPIVGPSAPSGAGAVVAPPLTWGPEDDPIASTILVVAAHDDDLEWLKLQPFQPVVMVKGRPEGTPNNIPMNWGREASSYLQFILEHYDNLPPRMVFMHGHNTSWHLKVRCRCV
jgi:hypothetical protein